jgi:uncharacterized protein YbdZ (MbtH family)
MGAREKEGDALYDVVVNHEGRYSLWAAYRGDPPKGWRRAGVRGSREECLAYVREVWADVGPLGVGGRSEVPGKRRPELGAEGAAKAEVEGEPEAGGESAAGVKAEIGREGDAETTQADPRDDLVGFLSEGDHPVELSLRPESSVRLFKNAIDRGYVHVKFTDTRGGTELGVELDPVARDAARADLEKGAGDVHIEGALTLNYAKVRCVADIALDTLSGRGRLERVE